MSTETQSFKGVGTPTTRMYGLMAVIALGWVFLGGLFFTPEDAVQGDAVRIMYVHVPTAWVAYLAFIVTGVASACWLIGKKHSMGFDRVAGASAEVGVLFMARQDETGRSILFSFTFDGSALGVIYFRLKPTYFRTIFPRHRARYHQRSWLLE